MKGENSLEKSEIQFFSFLFSDRTLDDKKLVKYKNHRKLILG